MGAISSDGISRQGSVIVGAAEIVSATGTNELATIAGEALGAIGAVNGVVVQQIGGSRISGRSVRGLGIGRGIGGI